MPEGGEGDLLIIEQEQNKEILDSLVGFVKRVSENQHASPAELHALPAIAKVLAENVTVRSVS